jgi:DNA polymerase-1
MDLANVPRSQLTRPAIAYCTTAEEACRLIDEMVLDAGGRPVAIDIETTSTESETIRLAALRLEHASAAGKLKAARRVKAPKAEIEALAVALKALKARIGHAGAAGLDPHRSRIRLLQIYGGGRGVAVIDLDRTGPGVLQKLDGVDVVAHNVAFELAHLEHAGVGLGEVHCAMQAARLTLGEHAMSLADAAAAYLGATINKDEQTGNWGLAHLTLAQLEYAAQDVVACWEIGQRIFCALGPQQPAYEVQIACTPAVARMELRGFRLDVVAHANLIEALKRERDRACVAYAEACLAHGREDLAKVRPPATPTEMESLLKALLTSEELARWQRTEKKGALSTKRSDLRRAAHYPPIAALVKLAAIDKLLSAFGPTLSAVVSSVTGRIHANYRVAATASGRATCSKPNLQQMPRDKRFRALFKPEPGNVLIVADYASMELRAAAHISDDCAMTAAFEKGLDLHRITAARMLGKTPEEVTAEERDAAKPVNFGACYGLGVKGLVRSAWDRYSIVLTDDEADLWLRAFKDAYPQLTRWRREHAWKCEDAQRVVIGKDAPRGRGRFFPKSRLKPGKSYYTRACNLPVQGSCADASMLALAAVDNALFDAEIDGGPIAWLHDEIVLEVPIEDAERAAALLKQAMVTAFAETFPGAPLRDLVEPRVGLGWGEAKSALPGISAKRVAA